MTGIKSILLLFGDMPSRDVLASLGRQVRPFALPFLIEHSNYWKCNNLQNIFITAIYVIDKMILCMFIAAHNRPKSDNRCKCA